MATQSATEAGELPDAPGGPEALDRIQDVYSAYIKAAIVIALTAGSLWGLHLISYQALGKPLMPAWTEAHAHAQFFGWVGLMVLGVSIFAVPRFTRANFQRTDHLWAIFWLLTGGIVLRVALQPFATQAWTAWPLRAAGVMELAAIGWFVYLVSKLSPETGTLKVPEYFTIAAYVALLGAAGMNVWATEQIIASAAEGTAYIAPFLNRRMIFLLVWGFGANIIFGVGTRMLPPLMGLKEHSPVTLRISFSLFNLGVLGGLLTPAEFRAIPGALLFSGGALFLHGLRVFEPTRKSGRHPATDASFPWYVRAAFIFMALALVGRFALDTAHLFGGEPASWNLQSGVIHAATVGFISTMIVGVGQRVLPDFCGNSLYSEKLMRVAFWHLIPGTAIRVAAELAGGSASVWQWTAAAGATLQFAAIAIFGVNIWLTLAGVERGQPSMTPDEIDPRTKLNRLFDEFPAAQRALVEMGIEEVEGMSTIPDRFTLGFAAGMHDRDPERVSSELKKRLTETDDHD